jgi:LacI family transcriptional regulator
VRRKRAGIRDVATAAGVSVTTVSHVLNEVAGARVAEATRRRVRTAAEQLSYAPSRPAQSLRLQQSHAVGLISDHIATTPYAGQIILGAQEAMTRRGWVMLVVNTVGDAEVERRELEALGRHQVDGVLYASMRHRHLARRPESLPGVPIVLVDAGCDDAGVPAVVPDEVGGACAAVEELVGHGHTRIGFINDDEDIPAAHGRLEGYRAALERAGLPYDPRLVAAEYPAEAATGHRAAMRLLGAPDPPTALFCFHDRMAMGAYRAAAELGLRIPDDLSIVGFDDLRFIAAELHPGLTTVALPHHEMGTWAAEALLDGITEPERAPAGPFPHVVPCPIVRRASVGPPRA